MGKKVVSFLASGRGSNFTKVAQEILNQKINAKLGILIADNQNAKALEIARNFGMESYFVDPSEYLSREEHEQYMVNLFKEAKTDLIVAAGYMRLLTPYFVKKYKNKIINIHPALLPSFPGINSQKKAFDYGVKITGCTSHFIDEGKDTGPIILQSAIKVLDNDTENSLSSRILKEEHKILPDSVRLFCDNKLKVIGRKVKIKS